MNLTIYILAYAFIIFSFLPLIKIDCWIVRVFDYPRYQKLFILTVLSILSAVFLPHSLAKTILLILQSGTIGYLCWQIYPYTSFSAVQLQQNKEGKGSKLKLLITNVRQKNRESQKCLSLIQKMDPDLILLVETNQWWDQELSSLKQHYPFHMLVPMENTYGMLLYSKYELVDRTIRFLVDPEIPSIRTKVKLETGETISLYGLHPTPPVPAENLESTDRDAEILLVGKEAKELATPVIVAGDLNDVAWSSTTRLFLKVSGLLDPRRGRGFYNTFHAHYWLFRWPLDHVFCSAHFELIKLIRLPDIGSDHFPIFIELALTGNSLRENQGAQLASSTEDEEEANQKIMEAAD